MGRSARLRAPHLPGITQVLSKEENAEEEKAAAAVTEGEAEYEEYVEGDEDEDSGEEELESEEEQVGIGIRLCKSGHLCAKGRAWQHAGWRPRGAAGRGRPESPDEPPATPRVTRASGN